VTLIALVEMEKY